MGSEDTQLKKGNPGNGGRPKGSRNRLSEAFLKALADDFEEHGPHTVEILRKGNPAQYCNVIARLLPKLMELSGPEGGDLADQHTWKIEFVEPESTRTNP